MEINTQTESPPVVRLDVTDGVATITLDQPPVNALDVNLLDALAGIAGQITANDAVRAVVLTGAGDKAFAAGADIGEFAQRFGDEEWLDKHLAAGSRTLELVRSIPQPTVAAVQASAVGGGLELALVCDLIVVDGNARLGLPEVKLGLMPGAGGTQRLAERIGSGRARELLLLGTLVDAETALRIGLANRVTEPGGALAEALAIASRIAGYSTVATRAIKEASTTSARNSVATDGLLTERELFRRVCASEDAREGVRAFAEKRSPLFKHR